MANITKVKNIASNDTAEVKIVQLNKILQLNQILDLVQEGFSQQEITDAQIELKAFVDSGWLQDLTGA